MYLWSKITKSESRFGYDVSKLALYLADTVIYCDHEHYSICAQPLYIYTVTRCDPLQLYTRSASALVAEEWEKCTQIKVAQVQDP